MWGVGFAGALCKGITQRRAGVLGRKDAAEMQAGAADGEERRRRGERATVVLMRAEDKRKRFKPPSSFFPESVKAASFFCSVYSVFFPLRLSAEDPRNFRRFDMILQYSKAPQFFFIPCSLVRKELAPARDATFAAFHDPS